MSENLTRRWAEHIHAEGCSGRTAFYAVDRAWTSADAFGTDLVQLARPTPSWHRVAQDGGWPDLLPRDGNSKVLRGVLRTQGDQVGYTP